MPQEPNPSFEDAALKAALRGTIGRKTAPPGLRQRVQDALRESESMRIDSDTSPKRSSIFRSPLIGLAIAAMIVIAAGVAWKFMQSPSSDVKPQPIVASLPKWIGEAMVKSHDEAIAKLDSSATLSAEDLNNEVKSISTEIGRTVLAASPGGEWNARLIQTPNISGEMTAQIVFTNGSKTISVYSIPATGDYGLPDGTKYETTLNRHAIAGFVRTRTMYCIVGDAGVSLEEVRALAETLAAKRG